MTTDTGGALCGSCGTPLPEPTSTPRENCAPCPKCGSTIRQVRVAIRATMTARAMLSGKKRLSKGRKPTVRFKVGDDLWRKLNRWVNRELYADRENDWYQERVVDPETGQVIHECNEPLSRHRGHGSAKKKGTS